MVLTNVFASRTIRINDTFRFATGDGVRVGNQTRLTSANGVSRGSNRTNSSRATWTGITGIRSWNTFLLLTNIVSRAIRINDTFRSTTSNGIRLGDQTRFTSEKNYS